MVVPFHIWLNPEPFPECQAPSYNMRLLSNFAGRIELTAFSQLEWLLRKILPVPQKWERDRVTSDGLTFHLRPHKYPDGYVAARGHWIDRDGNRGLGIVSFCERVSGLTYSQAIQHLAVTLKMKWSDRQVFEKISGRLKLDENPLQIRPTVFSVGEGYAFYFAETGRPNLVAIKRRFPFYTIDYLIRCESRGHDSFWVPAMPEKLPFFKVPFPGQPSGAVRFLPSEFDPRFEKASEWLLTAVPGGNGNLYATELSIFAGWNAHIEFQLNELINAELILSKVRGAGLKACTFNLIGETRSYDIGEIVALAEKRGFIFDKVERPQAPEVLTNRGTRRAGDKIAEQLVEREVILAPFLSAGGLCWFFGPPGIGKSYSLMYFAYLMSLGGRLGFVRSAGGKRVFYLDGEVALTVFENALVRICRGAKDTSGKAPFGYWCAKGTPEGVINLLESVWQERLLEELAQEKIEVLILDNFYSLTNDHPSEFPEFLKLLQKIQAMGVAIIVSDHTNRKGELQGHGTKPRVAETIVEVGRPEKARLGDGLISFEVTKARDGIIEEKSYLVARKNFADGAFKMEPVDDEHELTAEDEVSDESVQLAQVVYLKDHLGLSFPKIQDQFGIRRSTAGDRYKKAKSLKGEERFAFVKALQKFVGEQREGE